jgi:hypothetical protein
MGTIVSQEFVIARTWGAAVLSPVHVARGSIFGLLTSEILASLRMTTLSA